MKWLILHFLLLLAAMLPAVDATAATAEPPIPRPTSHPSVTMGMLLEKTIFQVDVLTLDIWFGPETALQLKDHLPSSDSDGGDAVANIAMQCRDAWATMEFRRDVSLNRFLDGIDTDMRKARDAGPLDATGYDIVANSLPGYFAPLAERGIKAQDRLFYRILGDSLHTVFQQEDGLVVIDQTDIGPERRLSLLGSFFVKDSDFRSKLLESLLFNSKD